MNSLLLKYYVIKKQQFLLFFFGMFSITSIAQKEITITDVLKGTQYIEQIQLDSIHANFLKGYNHKLPFVDNLELRTETSSDFLLNRQEYAIRLKTNSIREILANKKVYQSKINEVEIQGKIHYKEELEDRYDIMINYIFNERLTAAYKERKIQLQDKLTILQHTIYEENFDVKGVVETEEALFETEMTLLQLNEFQVYNNKVLQQMVGVELTPIYLNSYDLITPNQMIANYIEINPNSNLEIQLKQSELEILNNEMQLDVVKSKRIIDFVQAKYVDENSAFFDENFSISLGINLPFFGSTRTKKSDYYFDMLSVESEILGLQENLKKKENKAYEKFKSIISKYKAFQNQLANSSISSLLNTYKNIEGVNPLTLVLLKISEHDKEIELLNIEYNLYKDYMSMLASKNLLYQVPLKNYLSSNISIIKE